MATSTATWANRVRSGSSKPHVSEKPGIEQTSTILAAHALNTGIIEENAVSNIELATKLAIKTKFPDMYPELSFNTPVGIKNVMEIGNTEANFRINNVNITRNRIIERIDAGTLPAGNFEQTVAGALNGAEQTYYLRDPKEEQPGSHARTEAEKRVVELINGKSERGRSR